MRGNRPYGPVPGENFVEMSRLKAFQALSGARSSFGPAPAPRSFTTKITKPAKRISAAKAKGAPAKFTGADAPVKWLKICVKSSGPMIVVMEQGYARRPGEPATPRPAQPGQSPPRPDFSRMFSAFEDVMIKDLIPMVDATYRTIPDRESRAMAGLSMGGMQTFQITLNRLDLFSHIGGFSGAGGLTGRALDPKADFNGAFADPKAFASKVRLLWLGIGTNEPERMREGIRGLHKSLTDAGIDHVYYESPGTDHDSP